MRLIFSSVLLLMLIQPAQAVGVDSDNDGIFDDNEISIYHTDPQKLDTDNDGYDDNLEIKNGYSPLKDNRARLGQSDFDNDGLSDWFELQFHTDLAKADTDGDGYNDWGEINNGYDPLSKENKKLSKKIEINLKKQELYYFLAGVKLAAFKVSSGKASMPTPKGTFKISNKSLKAWSHDYGLWMPYWLGIKGKNFGIHELPVWPNGYREGANHLGTPVSHGCVRLGIGPAQKLFNWAEIGTEVKIY